LGMVSAWIKHELINKQKLWTEKTLLESTEQVLTIPSVSGSFTLDDLRKAFEGGRDSKKPVKCEKYGDGFFCMQCEIIKSFKTWMHENYR
jgi:hypothetical protein